MKEIKEINLFDVEDIISNKLTIEQKLIERGDIEEKLTLQDFITKYLVTTDVYMYKQQQPVPFTLTKIADDDYLIICTDNKDHHNRLTKLLKRIDYKLSKLKPIDVYKDNTINDFDNVFYINNQIYVI